MRIKKYLWGNPLWASVEQLRNLTSQLVGNMINNVATQSKEAENRIKVLSKADARANKKTKAPMKANELAVLQDKLWELGAFKGIKNRLGKDVTYELAVDGLIGRTTRQALANARLMGHNFDNYDINEKSGLVTKKTPSKKITVTATPKLEEVIDPYTGMPLNISEGYGDSNLGNGYSTTVPNGNLTLTYKYIKNLYPYGYLDEPGTANLKGFIDKILGGFSGPSERKEHLDAIIDLDLSDPELRKIAESHRKYFDNFKYSNIDLILQSARIREDANRLYTGMPQKYDTFIINPDYKSATAESKGLPTYTFKDPKLRKQYLLAGFSFNSGKNVGVHSAKDNQKSIFNRFSVVKTNDDNSGRYLEEWDLLGVGTPVYIGDTIPSNVGKGRAFAENDDDTPTNFKGFVEKLIANKNH